MKKAVLILMIISVISKFLGFGRELVLSYYYGTSAISDIYLVSLTIPAVLFSFFVMAISTGYIPIYNKIIIKDGESKAIQFTNNLINILMIICTGIVILCFLFTKSIVKLFASGFTGDVLAQTITYTRIGIFSIYTLGIIQIYSGYLHVKKKFIPPALLGIPLSIFVVLSIVLSKYINIIFLPLGTLAAHIFQLFFLVIYVLKEKYSYSVKVDFKDPYVKKLILISLPLLIGVSINQINVLVDKTIASQLAVGAISALNYANRLNLFIQGVFVTSIVTVLYPTMSKMLAEGDIKGYKKTFAESVTGINLFVVPAAVGSMVLAEPIVTMLFGRGAFDTKSINLTTSALFFYSFGMVAFGLREAISRAFYSMHDTKTPMINGAIGIAINIALNIILSKFLGVGGLALATSISAIITTGLMFISLNRKIGYLGMKRIGISFLKIVFASLIMIVIAKLSYSYLYTVMGLSLSLCISIVVGAASYSLIIFRMKIKDVDVIVDTLKNKLYKSNK